MTDARQSARRSYRAGDWYAIFGEHASVLLPASEKARVAELWELVDGGSGFDELLDALIGSGLRNLPGFVLVSTVEDPCRIVLRGSARAVVHQEDGEVVEFDGSSAATWVERAITGVASLQLLLEESGDEVDYPILGGLVRASRVDQPPCAEPAAEPDMSADVGLAVVPDLPSGEEADILDEGGDLEETVLDMPAVEEPSSAWGHDPLGIDPQQQAPESPLAPGRIDPDPPVWEPPPVPQAPQAPIWGAPPAPVEDSDHDGHTIAGSFNRGQFARQHPGIPGQPPAPSVTAQPVARLVFSHGETVDVDRAVLVGRAPEARRFTSTDQPRLVTVPSPNQEISSTHLEVRPGSGADHGSAIVTDLGSTNGSVLTQPGFSPEDLQPGIAVQLLPGAVVDLGDGLAIQVTSV